MLFIEKNIQKVVDAYVTQRKDEMNKRKSLVNLLKK